MILSPGGRAKHWRAFGALGELPVVNAGALSIGGGGASGSGGAGEAAGAGEGRKEIFWLRVRRFVSSLRLTALALSASLRCFSNACFARVMLRVISWNIASVIF